jgi:HEAT repeat protein
MMNDVIGMLEEGDLRTVGKVSEVLGAVAEQPDLFDDLIQAMAHSDPGVRMRASDAVEKITRTQPEYLQPHKKFVLKQVVKSRQQEVRWHLAQIVPRLELSPRERSRTAEVLFSFLDDPSKIVQTNALQALVDLAWEDDVLFPRVRDAVERLAEEGSPAVSNRAGKLFLKLDEQ